MKHLISVIIIICSAACCFAQAKPHKVSLALQHKMDTAISMYTNAAGDTGKLKKIIPFLNGMIKKDSLYFDAWNNRLTVECQLNRFSVALKTVRDMNRLFPGQPDALLLGGIIEYHTGHKKEATHYFNKLLSLDNATLKGHEKDPGYKGVWINKGMVLILLDRAGEGKAILQKIYDAEEDPYVQSYIGFYLMKTKEEIITDKIPGR